MAAGIMATEKVDFNVDPIWWGLPQLSIFSIRMIRATLLDLITLHDLQWLVLAAW